MCKLFKIKFDRYSNGVEVNSKDGNIHISLFVINSLFAYEYKGSWVSIKKNYSATSPLLVNLSLNVINFNLTSEKNSLYWLHSIFSLEILLPFLLMQSQNIT